MCARVCACVRARACACVCVRARECVCVVSWPLQQPFTVYARVHMYVCVCVHTHTHTHTHLHRYISPPAPAHIPLQPGTHPPPTLDILATRPSPHSQDDSAWAKAVVSTIQVFCMQMSIEVLVDWHTLSVYTHMCVCTHTCVCVHTHLCVHTHVCVYTHTYVLSRCSVCK